MKLLRLLVVIAVAALAATAPTAQTAFFPLDEVRPGMVGVGRTVFEGDTIEEFKVHIIGVLKNVVGPSRSLVLARLEGGPLAKTGVIAGMSGSPVYIDGRMLGAVSYQLGQFSKEPIAGSTPIGEMIADATLPGPRPPAAPGVHVGTAVCQQRRRRPGPRVDEHQRRHRYDAAADCHAAHARRLRSV